MNFRRFCAIFVLFTTSFLPFYFAFGQTNAVTLTRVLYLTNNLDSLSKAFLSQGFAVQFGDRNPLVATCDRIVLPSSQITELWSPRSNDDSDWRAIALKQFGTHVSGIVLHVENTEELARLFDSIHVPHGSVMHDGPITYAALTDIAPLDIVFASDTTSQIQLPVDAGTNRLTRVSWLLLTASPASESYLRTVFEALGLRKLHEGCCDYWLIGPPDNRVAVRFELPSTTFLGTGNWLSIEPGGVVFMY